MEVSLPPKPRYRQPCNGCGICCAVEVCVFGEAAHGKVKPPCPSLKINADGKGTYCELVEIEIRRGFEPIMQNILGIGHGCGMRDIPIDTHWPSPEKRAVDVNVYQAGELISSQTQFV